MNTSYRDLYVWKAGVDLVSRIYELTDSFPCREHFGLAAQLRRAGVSVPSNIAEGQGRVTKGEWIQFLGHARGSLYELETQIIIAGRLGYLSPEDTLSLRKDVGKLGGALNRFIAYVRSRSKST